jgi:hypothetical protein
MTLTKELDSINIPGSNNRMNPTTPKTGGGASNSNVRVGGPAGPPSRSPVTVSPVTPYNKSNEALIDVLKLRENRLFRSEDVMAKFLEVTCPFV